MGLFRAVSSYFAIPLFFVLSVSPVLAEEDGIEMLKKALAEHLPSTEISHVSKTPVAGLYEVIVGAQVVYMDKTARYMLDGDLVDLSTRKNHTELAKSKIRLGAMNALGENNMLVYTPKQVDHTITVVTDIDCPYCRRLHSEMNEYMDNNVKVRYIFMPLKGQHDYETTVSVWCSKDQNKALDLAKSGADIKSLTCDNPIKDHLALAREVGVRGTPAIILESGEMLPGYVPAAKLLQELNKSKAALLK